MSPDQQIERSMLDGKDREQLHTIAGAVGVKGATRMRKADLIEAILATANAAAERPSPETAEPTNGADAPKTRRVRSVRASELVDDSLAALAEEENSLGGDIGDADELPAPRPVRTRASAPAPAPEPAVERATVAPEQDERRATPPGQNGSTGTTTGEDSTSPGAY